MVTRGWCTGNRCSRKTCVIYARRSWSGLPAAGTGPNFATMASASALGWQVARPWVEKPIPPRDLTLWCMRRFDPVVPALTATMVSPCAVTISPRLGAPSAAPTSNVSAASTIWYLPKSTAAAGATPGSKIELLTIPCVPELVPVTRLVTLTRVAVGNTAWWRGNQTPCWARRSRCGVVSGVIISARKPSKPTTTICVGGIVLPFPWLPVLHRLDSQTFHETVLDIGGALGRAPGCAFCVNNGDDNPGARL